MLWWAFILRHATISCNRLTSQFKIPFWTWIISLEVNRSRPILNVIAYSFPTRFGPLAMRSDLVLTANLIYQNFISVILVEHLQMPFVIISHILSESYGTRAMTTAYSLNTRHPYHTHQYNAFRGRRTSERDSEPCTCEIAPGFLRSSNNLCTAPY